MNSIELTQEERDWLESLLLEFLSERADAFSEDDPDRDQAQGILRKVRNEQ